MIDWVVDVLLYVLLLAAIGFGMISLTGMLIFPDIRSRVFTGIRAALISLLLVTVAGILYGTYLWSVTGGLQYLYYSVSVTCVCVFIIVINRFISGQISKNPVPVISLSKEKEPDKE